MQRIAPDFNLPDQNGQSRKKSDYAGLWLVVFFYPKDNSINCTREICAFRDEFQIVKQFGNAEIVGINIDSVESHNKLARRRKINFPLLSDADGSIAKAYGAWRSNRPRLYDTFFSVRRNTYLVNPEGQIVKEYLSVKPGSHPEEVIIDLQAFQKQYEPKDK